MTTTPGPSEIPNQPSDGVVFAVGSKFAEVVATPGRPAALRVTNAVGQGVLVEGTAEMHRLAAVCLMVADIDQVDDAVAFA